MFKVTDAHRFWHHKQMTGQSTTPLADFIDQLMREGRAMTRGQLHRKETTDVDTRATASVLLEAERLVAADAPWPVDTHRPVDTPWPADTHRATPTFDADVSVWAAKSFAWGTGMLVDRGETDVTIPDWILRGQPSGRSATDHWSVDIVFRLANDLMRMSRRICAGDPLECELEKLFSPWPMACVGTTIENPDETISVVIDNDCLRTIYVDRILLRKDSARSQSARIRPWIDRVVGGHPELGIETS